MTSIPDIKKSLQEFLALDGKRTQGEWYNTPFMLVHSHEVNFSIDFGISWDRARPPDANPEFVVACANQSGQMARQLLIAIEALEVQDCDTANQGFFREHDPTCRRCRAIDKIQEMK